MKMATEGGGKIKEKRSHPSVKPYERRKSLLGKVTKTVKDLFVPSWLNEWVSKTPESRNEDGVVGDNLQRQDVQGSRLEGPQLPGPSQLPYVVPFSSSELPLPGARPPQSTPREDSRSVLSEASVKPVPDSVDYQREILQLNDTGLERLRESLEKDLETTQSFLPNTDPGLSPRSMSMSVPPVQPPLTPQAFFGGGSQSQPKVYSSSAAVRRGKPFTPAHRSRPSFNVSAFCSTSQGEQSLLGESLFESSFYSGMTTYGGASAHRRRSGGAATPYQTALPIRRQLKTRPTEQAQGAVTSSTARRILETLERMSTPLGDARRIPVETANVDSVLSFTPSLVQRTSLLRSSERQSQGPPTRRVQVPGVASIAKNRQTFRLASPLTTSTPATAPKPSTAPPAPQQPSATVTSESRESLSERLARADTVPVDKLTGGGAGGKMRRERSNHHFKAAKADSEDMMVDELPKFNTNFTLPVSGTSMPKIDFGFTSPAATAASKTSSGPSTSSTLPSSGSGNGIPALGFTFSSPISKSSPASVDQTDAGSSPADFKFRSPVQAQGSITAADSTTRSSSSSVSMTSVSETKTSTTTTPLVGNGGFAFSGGLTAGKPVLAASAGLTSTPPAFNAGFGKPGTAFSSLGGSASSPPQPPMFGAAKELRSGSVMDVLGKKPSPAREEGLGLKPAAELRTGSVMDILGKGASPSTSKDESFSGGIRTAAELKKGSVMDILGKSASPPASSFGIQPARSLEQGSVNDILGGKKDTKAGEDIFAKFQAAAGSWECSSCLVQNKAEANICVACCSTKPSAKNAAPQTTAAAAAPTTDPLFAKLAQPAGMWECEVCCVQNKSESSSCAACSTPKPGGASAPAPTPTSALAPAATTAAQGFGSSLLAQFAKPAGGWECQACLVQNKAGEDKCVACSSARPGAASDTKKNGPSSTTGGSVGSLAAQFKRPAGDWNCQMCDVFNKSSSITCVCCNTPRPGMEPSAALAKTVPMTSFTLGSQTTTTTTTSSSSSVTINSGGGFSFNFSNATTPATTSGFKFGSADSNETKSGSSSQAPASGGFQFGASEQSKPLGGASALAEKTAAPVLSTGGFKFGAEQQPVTSQLSTGTAGFTFGQSKSLGTPFSPAASSSIGGGLGESKAVQETSASAASVPAGAGTTPGFFSFGQKPQESQGLVSSASSLPGGFSFGQKPSNSQPPPPAAAPSGFSFGPKASEPSFPSPSPALAGIVFGQKPVDNPPATSASPAVPAVGEFSFGQKQPSVSAPTTSVPSMGGFVFGASGVSNKSVDQTVAPSPLAGVAGNATLFGGVGSISKTADKTAGEDKARGFSFGGVTSGQTALTGAAAATNENKPAFGGFNFGVGQAASTPTLPSAFGMASSSGPALGVPAKPSFAGLGNKRGHDDDLNPPQAKKTFSFGNGPTEAAFGAASSAAAPANSNAFKPTPNDGGFNPAPAATANFNFGGTVNTGGVFHFGQSDSSNSTGGAQVANSFNFGQPPSLPSNPSFSVPSASSFNIGSSGQNAGGPVRQIKKAARRLKR